MIAESIVEGDKTPIPFTINADLTGSETAHVFAWNLVTQQSVDLSDHGSVAAPAGRVVTWTPDGTLPRGSYVAEVEINDGIAGPYTFPSDPADRPAFEVVADLG